jgi:hypothetical protein
MSQWSNSPSGTNTGVNQFGKAISQSADGHIFMTGYVANSFTVGGTDCFIMKLNSTSTAFNSIWVKSFGQAAVDEQCT